MHRILGSFLTRMNFDSIEVHHSSQKSKAPIFYDWYFMLLTSATTLQGVVIKISIKKDHVFSS